MKFTDGFWQLRPGVHPVYAQEAYAIDAQASDEGDRLVVTAPTKVIERRGDTLNRPVLTVSLSSPMEGVVTVRVEHHRGRRPELSFPLDGRQDGHGTASVVDGVGTLTSGDLSAVVSPGAPWDLRFTSGGRVLTGSGHKSLAHVTLEPDAEVSRGVVGNARVQGADAPTSSTFVHAQLDLGVGELVYGLGERFGPLVKNGQTVDIWNADGGTSSEQAYKNVPFYLTNRGYGVLVDHPGHVSFEVGSEAVERVQFSVPGESLVFHVIGGGTPEGVLERYTALTGRPAHVPAWSYGLWLSTSFTTDYDEATVTSFVDRMAANELPVSVFHFDCFWMREFAWCDFEWDPRVFPDPEGMLQRLHDKDLRVCVWINPYIGQASKLFDEAAEAGYLVRNADGTVWQWDLWQAGMGLVDFTNPDAKRWYQDRLRALVAQGVDCFKTDFGERIPLGVAYHDGSDPERMHNWYTQLYNEAVFEVLQETRGEGDAVLFARSATVGGQKMPVHWGGDNTSSLPSMAETLRGGLSLALSGFGFWSHDIGGFEGTPDAGVFKRWVQFGLLSSHSRFHGSSSYRVPWAFDDEAVAVTKAFTELKLRLMPYLYAAGLEASARGIPVMRPMVLAFPDDPTAAYCDRQYLLGPDLLVAPVFDESGDVTYYLPHGSWTNWFTGETVTGGAWRTERHGYDTLPLWVRGGAVLPLSTRTDRPDHDYRAALELRVFPDGEDARSGEVGAGAAGRARSVTVTAPDGSASTYTVEVADGSVTATGPDDGGWGVSVAATGPAAVVAARGGRATTAFVA